MNQATFHYETLLETVLNSVDYESVFPCSNFDTHKNHEQYFVQHIIEEYIRCRSNHIARNTTLNNQEKTLLKRMKKIRHLRGQ